MAVVVIVKRRLVINAYNLTSCAEHDKNRVFFHNVFFAASLGFGLHTAFHVGASINRKELLAPFKHCSHMENAKKLPMILFSSLYRNQLG